MCCKVLAPLQEAQTPKFPLAASQDGGVQAMSGDTEAAADARRNASSGFQG